MKMTAAVLDRTGASRPYAESAPLRIEEIDLEGPGPGQVLVEMASAGLCHSDLSAIEGVRRRALPSVIGHEGAGVVVEVGAGVDDVREGDHVVMVFVSSCGRCEHCVTGHPNLCTSSWGARAAGTLSDGSRHLARGGEPLNHWSGISSFADFAVVARSSVIVIDPAVPLLDAAVFGCAVVTGVGSVLNTARVRPGDGVAVVGLGGVGLSAVMGAALAGAGVIVAVDAVEEKLGLARELGATHALNAREPDLVDTIVELTGGGVHHAFEMAGVPAAARTAYASLRRGGTYIAASLPKADQVLEIPLAALASDEKRVVGSYMGSSVPTRDIPRYVELFQQGRLPVDRLRSAVLELHDCNAGFDRLAEGRAVREIVGFGAAA